MKLILINICLFLISALSFSQIYEIGGFIGGSNFIGDVGSTTFINPNEPAFGGVIKWNRSPRHAFRASLIYTTLSANDEESSDPRREIRGYSFSAGTLEASLGIEFNFLDILIMYSIFSSLSINEIKDDNTYFSIVFNCFNTHFCNFDSSNGHCFNTVCNSRGWFAMLAFL